MNANKKKAAVEKYGNFKGDDLVFELENSDKDYTPEEIVEIVKAIQNPEAESTTVVEKSEPKQASQPAKKEAKRITANLPYEEWRVSSKRDKTIPEGYVYEKEKHIKDVEIAEDTASILNEQSMNSKIRYYLKS